MSVVSAAKWLPPPPSPSDWIVTVWVREGGVVSPRRVATDATDAQKAAESAVRHLQLHKAGAPRIADIRVRRRG